MNNNEGLISVVMPVYNGALYLRQTIQSIVSQTYRQFEFLIIDDGSIDDSLYILKEFERNDPRIHVFHKENGGTVPKAINHILDSVKGQFYFYLSQDDLLSEDLFEKLVNRYLETGADVVLPDLVFQHDGESEKDYRVIGFNGDRKKVLTNKDAVIGSLDWHVHGFGLWNSELIKKLRYDEFSLNSDEYSTRVFFFHCNKIVFCDGSFYYRQRANSITKKLTPKIFDFAETNRRLYNFLLQNNFEKKVIDKQLVTNASQLIISVRNYLRNSASFSSVDNINIRNILLTAYNEIDRKRLLQLACKSQFPKFKLIYYIFRNISFFFACCKLTNFVFRIVKIIR